MVAAQTSHGRPSTLAVVREQMGHSRVSPLSNTLATHTHTRRRKMIRSTNWTSTNNARLPSCDSTEKNEMGKMPIQTKRYLSNIIEQTRTGSVTDRVPERASLREDVESSSMDAAISGANRPTRARFGCVWMHHPRVNSVLVRLLVAKGDFRCFVC